MRSLEEYVEGEEMLGDLCGPASLCATAYNGSSSGLWAWDEDPRPCLKMGPLRLSLRCGYLLPEYKTM